MKAARSQKIKGFFLQIFGGWGKIFAPCPPLNKPCLSGGTTHRVNVVNVFLSLVVLSLHPVTVEVLADPVQNTTGELKLLPGFCVELENQFAVEPFSPLGGSEECSVCEWPGVNITIPYSSYSQTITGDWFVFSSTQVLLTNAKWLRPLTKGEGGSIYCKWLTESEC